jgi:putative endonuclease
MQEYYVYILANKRNGTLYVGMTKDIAKRAVRHKDRRANQFAAKYDVDKLVYYEKYKSLEEAVKREKQAKKWRREWKIKMIERRNPEWKDLVGEVIKAKIGGSPVAEPK